jgi:hypothetical protein
LLFLETANLEPNNVSVGINTELGDSVAGNEFKIDAQ